MLKMTYNPNPSKRDEEHVRLPQSGGDFSEDKGRVGFDASRRTFTDEDPRVMPFCPEDIEVINRVEGERWFGQSSHYRR